MAKGFILIATKWLIVVRLLLGEVPERAEFQQPGMTAALQPYLALSAAVRGGDVGAFESVAEAHAAAFKADRVNLLVGRLRFNVIRSGLLRISVSYSRISLQVRRRVHCLTYALCNKHMSYSRISLQVRRRRSPLHCLTNALCDGSAAALCARVASQS